MSGTDHRYGATTRRPFSMRDALTGKLGGLTTSFLCGETAKTRVGSYCTCYAFTMRSRVLKYAMCIMLHARYAVSGTEVGCAGTGAACGLGTAVTAVCGLGTEISATLVPGGQGEAGSEAREG
eukprot:2892848-Rhodomonas_salina.1